MKEILKYQKKTMDMVRKAVGMPPIDEMLGRRLRQKGRIQRDCSSTC